MLGVELGEKFKIKGEDELMTYRFSSDGLQVTYGDGIEIPYISTNSAFVALVTGKDEVVKLLWEPKMYEEYWTFCSIQLQWSVTSYRWQGNPDDVATFKVGWVYRTREEAETALPAVAKEIGVEYKL
jgi:hypothetical protein